MKKRVLLWMAGLVFAVTSLFAQDIPVGVVVAFKKGNSQELNRYLGEKVNLVIQNRSESVDRQVNHEGKRDESSFIIGTLTTANGNFRINCFFRRVQNKYLINQIRIDKTNE